MTAFSRAVLAVLALPTLVALPELLAVPISEGAFEPQPALADRATSARAANGRSF